MQNDIEYLIVYRLSYTKKMLGGTTLQIPLLI